MIKHNFITDLHHNTPMNYMDITNMVAFFEYSGKLNEAIMVYMEYGFSSLLDFRTSLMKKR